MKNKLKISIITSVFNGEDYIAQTIKSVLEQTYHDFEYIIIDGNSTDDTISIVRSFEEQFNSKKINYKWVSESDTGIYNAWNKALKVISGDWVVFIGADDYFINNKVLNNMIPFLLEAQSHKINYVYGQINHVSKSEKFIEMSGKPWHLQKERFCYSMNIGHSGAFHSKNLFKEHGMFNETFKITGDYEFLLREFKDPNKDALFVNKPCLVMREGGVSANLQNRLKVVKESQKARALNNINSFSKELFFWEFRVRVILVMQGVLGDSFASKVADAYRVLLGKQKRWSKL